MNTRRLIYIFTLIGLAAFFVLYAFWFSWYLLVLVLLLIPFDFIASLPGMLTKKILFSAPNMLEQGAEGTLVLTTLQEKPFPAKCIKAWMRISGEDFAVWRRFICGAEGGSRFEVAIDSSHSGVTAFELKRIWTVSLIGLFSLPLTVNRRHSILIMPAPAKPPNAVALPRGVIFRPKPGGGFAEDHDLRQYRGGDPVRSIHWKISAKFNSLIIREPLVPPPHSRLVHVARWQGAQESELILGRLRWVSDYLLKWEMPYFVQLGDDGPIAEISGERDLTDYLVNTLCGAGRKLPVPASLPVRFSWVFRVDAGDSAAKKECS